MNYIEFAENERLSTIVLGMMRISQMSEDEVEALVEAALSIGINTFDLADIYGDGQCEVLLGEVLKRRPDLRDQMWIQSKCGIPQKTALPILIFLRTIFWTQLMASSSVCRLNAWITSSFTDRMPSWSRKKWRKLFDHLEQAGKVRHFGVSNQKPHDDGIA